MHKSTLMGGIAALTLASACALADNTKQNMVAQGNWLGTLSGSVQSTKVSGGSNTTSSSSSIQGGYMLTNNIAVGLKAAYSSQSSFNTFTGFASARYYFNPQPSQTLVPFIGPFVGYMKPSGGSNTTMYGANAGVEYFVAPNVSLTPSVNYFHTTGGGVTADTFSFSVGLTFWFAGK